MKLIAALPVTVAVSILVAQTERPATHVATAVRHWSLTDMTRVSVEVTGAFHLKSDRLHDPERIYFDLVDVRPGIDGKRSYSEQLEDKFVHRIRVAETKPGVTRVVLDLAASAEVKSSQLTKPDRLMIEVRAGAPVTEPPAMVPPPPVSTMPAPLNSKVEAPKPDPSLKAQAKPPAKVEPELPEPPPAEPATGQMSKAPEKAAAAAATADLPRPVEAVVDSSSAANRFPEGEVGKAARHTAAGDTSLVRALGLKVTRVVIDPGHGGHDTGTSGSHGLEEKELVLDVSKRLGKLIEDRMGSEVIYTRTDDTFIPLEGRTAMANEKRADLFISIHANSSPMSKISGVEVYYLNFTDMKDALDVASRENASSQKSIFELRDIIQRITLHDKAEESKEFASRIQTSLFAFETKNFPGTKNRGVKKAPFIVLIGANMPSVLAEIGFLSNQREESLLKKPDYRQRLADALFRGVSRYADSLSHFQVADAPETPKKSSAAVNEERR
ncbi:MAG TPA: N-acetylmuramoyl-L-alanine amidase [Bryobacteraceae bacterium]|nr:N-acetylmuramoyl-L-alanine amidase [Bryobacteraceae bacterium]